MKIINDVPRRVEKKENCGEIYTRIDLNQYLQVFRLFLWGGSPGGLLIF
jgi:hypothetical protein